MKTRILKYYFLTAIRLICAVTAQQMPSQADAQQSPDSARLLHRVTITADLKQNPYASIVPSQRLNHEALELINSESIAGAAKYFSGVLIKDYGGVGGLKTISVRSLGGLNTGLVYDGISIADAQTGQIDLSKFSATFVQSLELIEANPQSIPAPARLFSSASILSFNSTSFNTSDFTRSKWIAGMNAGSFGLWQPFAGLYLPVGKNMVVSGNGEATWSKGNYPYTIRNGLFSEKTERINSDIKAFQGEINVVNCFRDSSQLQTKIWAYGSERGLPGTVIYFNPISVQRLKDNDVFIQSRYLVKMGSRSTLSVAAKYSAFYTQYTDSNFLNNAGGLDDRYQQNEIYATAAISRTAGKYFNFSLASDISHTTLSANIQSFPDPARTTWWNAFTMQFTKTNWRLNATMLNTNVSDQTNSGPAAENKNKFTSSVGLSYRFRETGNWLLRFFYKDVFRMPTFNDLYYTYNVNVNPKLRPEYAQQYDLGVTYTKKFQSALRELNISADAYYNSFQDKIIAVPGQNLFIWTMKNLGKVDIRGVDVNAEANGKFSPATRWSLRIAYTWQQALDITDPSGPVYKNEIPYTPQNSGSLLAVYYYRQWNAGYSMLFSGPRYVLGENNPDNRLGGWITQDVFIGWKCAYRQVQANIKAEVINLFDERYDVIRYYPMPGRSIKLGITINNL